MASNIPITNGQGQSSVAAEEIGALKYQQIKVIGGEIGSTSVWSIGPDGSAKVSVVGVINIAGSVAAIVTGTPSISGAVTVVGTPSISGTVNIGDIKQSVFGASVIGTVPVTQTTIPWAVVNVGSIISTPIGSIITVWQNSSIISIATGSVVAIPTGNQSVSGTIIATPTGNQSVSGTIITVWQAPSIVGTYVEDAAHTTGDRGVLGLGVRNDTLASITSADNDYSPFAVGPMGENIVANAPITKWIQGNASMASGISQPVVAAQGASVFTYITGIQIVNTTATNAFVTFLDSAGGGKIGYTVAPANGGSNIVYPNGLKTLANGAFHASINALASVLVSAQGFVSKL